ncbi:Clr6 histone deacetylase associated PHD protein-2 Cph2 [Gnomoniopsis sp. IMI 355080]|nr:Clr6 histone deacetylase associated PHD protein-2 Cph2 [Gnomoniopsis sp. IMI 355080]
MADQQQDPQTWGSGLDTTFEFQPNNDPLSAASAPSSVSASDSRNHIANGTAAPAPDSNHITTTTGPDLAFADFNENPAWADQSQFTPPLGPNDGDPLDQLSLFPDNWNVPSASFPAQSLQYRPRPGGPPQSQHNPDVGLYSGGFFNGPGANQPGGPPSQPGPLGVAMPTLTPAQQEQLRNIAMPPHLQYQSPKSEPSQLSPQSSNGDGPKGASPDSSKLSRKRKSSADDDDLDDEEDEDGNHPVKKTAHNMIEKRYRTNLNDKIAALRDSVPSLRVLSKSARGEDTTGDREELHGLTPAHKLNKATVLSKATEYIRHLEKRNNRLNDENSTMQQRISAFEKLFMANAMNGTMSPVQQNNGMQFGQDPAQFMTTPVTTPRGMDPQGMIPVPDDMKRIISAQLSSGRPYPVPQQGFQQNPAIMRQQQIQQQQQQMQNNRWQNAPFYGKFMVGSLAGLMFIESMREREQSAESPEGRGLFAIPIQLLGPLVSQSHVSIAGHQYSLIHMISTLKSLLLIGTLLWVFVPSVFAPRPPKTQKTHVINAALKAVPSLASPIHVRRQAWLTAIQTVWVPRHNFFLEAAALILKMMKLSLRNTIGVHGYQMLTGLTEEQETARVKAWTIALDAQLAGGDVEINKTRLTLTALASQTLPDTPLRLMLNALHIRVLLWQFGKQGVHNIVAAKLARSKWNEARQLYRLTNSLRRSEPPSPDDEIPEHLALLLEQDCDDILNDNIVQRAHNLAFNRPTTHDIDADVDGMNAVVEDPAVRSPMDAVAAWWSSLVLQRVLSASLSEWAEKREQANTMADGVHTAIKVAPIGSNAQVRALVVKAVIFDEKRGANIATVLKALGPSVNPDKHPQYSRGVPPLIDAPLSSITPDPDVQLALRCAMAIAHLQRFEVPPHSALTVVDTILPGSTEGLSLLGCTAAFHLMERLYSHAIAAEACASALERISGTLRLWIGSGEGNRPGLDRDIRQKMVERCLNVTKSVIGMDQGYATMTDRESEDDSCDSVE